MQTALAILVVLSTLLVLALAFPWIAYFLDEYQEWCEEKQKRLKNARLK